MHESRLVSSQNLKDLRIARGGSGQLYFNHIVSGAMCLNNTVKYDHFLSFLVLLIIVTLLVKGIQKIKAINVLKLLECKDKIENTCQNNLQTYLPMSNLLCKVTGFTSLYLVKIITS